MRAPGRRHRLSVALVVAVLGSFWLASPSAAQRADARSNRDGEHVAGVFDHYVLSLSWSPTHCVEEGARDDDPQCAPRPPRPYAFVLHGLWPQYAARGWPEFCRTRERPFVPDSVIGRMLEVMPSRRLVIHQYRKHGTCSGLDPAAYFDLAKSMYRGIRIPDRFVNPTAPFTIGRSEVVDAFLASNPTLTRDMIAVSCGGSGDRLREVRICYGRDGAPRGCEASLDQRRLCRANRLYVPPVRGGTRPVGEPKPLPPGLMPPASPQHRI